MSENWKESIIRKRAELADQLHGPMARLAALCAPIWGDRDKLDDLLREHFVEVPHVKYLYCVDPQGIQICDNVGADRLSTAHFGRDRSHRDYMREPVPPWGFLLSDAYVSQSGRPSITALHVVRSGDTLLGYLALFHEIGLDYTWSTFASEGGNFGNFHSHEMMKRLNAKIYAEARRLQATAFATRSRSSVMSNGLST